MQWTEKQSIHLSKTCLYLLALMIILTMVFMQPFIEIIVPMQAIKPEHKIWLFVTLQSCLAVGLVILYFLDRLISNIGNKKTFDEQNIKILRQISWLCLLETIVLLTSATYYLPWLFVAGVTAFVGIIVRIIKNVFCQALLIKKENDYTI